MTFINGRTSEHPIDKMFLERWSPRSFTGEAIPESVLLTILEAARWAPSSYNAQPWRFVYALRDTPHWGKLLDLLIEGNKAWAKNAAVLIVATSAEDMTIPGGGTPMPSHTHSFDTGAAWGYMALQARLSGWDAHGMIGFDVDRARAALSVPDGYRVEAAIAIGKRGDAGLLPERLAAREKPSDRLSLTETVFEGGFPG